ncbi:MAG: hypothetical protein GY796_05470 [Chloroflexi bacterium]|nr:hypothetical protein [Chloroflexota bacterium]
MLSVSRQKEKASDLTAYKQALLLHLSKFETGLLKANVENTLSNVLLADVKAKAARVREDLERPFTIAVIGHFNYGKSTLVNALLKQEISPTEILPETYAISEISYDSAEKALVHLADKTIEKYSLRDLVKERMLERLGHKLTHVPPIDTYRLHAEMRERFKLDDIRSICLALEIDFEDLPQTKKPAIVELVTWCQKKKCLPNLLEICQLENKKFDPQNIYQTVESHTASEFVQLAHHIEKIEVKAPVDILKGIRLIDTPGIGDHQKLDEQVQASLPQADVVIFVLLPWALLSQEEDIFLQRAVDKYDGAKFIFVVNQMDKISAKDIERIKEHAAKRVWASLPNAAIYYLSAREEFEYTQRSQTAAAPLQFHAAFQEFRAHLNKSIHRNRDVMQLERAISSVDHLLNSFETQVDQFRHAYGTDSATLQHKARQLQQPDSPLSQRVTQQQTAVKQEMSRLSTQACDWMDEFIDRLTAQTIPGLTEIRLVDIQQEFHFFLSDVVSQAMNACLDSQRPLLIETIHNAQETIRQEYEIVMSHTDLSSLDGDAGLDTIAQADWEKLEVYDQLLEQSISTVFAFTHELMHHVSHLMNANKNLPDWQARDAYKSQLYNSASQLREAITAEIRILYKHLWQDVDAQLNALSIKYQDTLLSTIRQAEALQKTIQSEYAASDQAVEDVKLRIQILRRQTQTVKLRFRS